MTRRPYDTRLYRQIAKRMRNIPCTICGALPGTADHIVALADGGSNTDPANFRSLCRYHNSQAGGRVSQRRHPNSRRRRRRWSNRAY